MEQFCHLLTTGTRSADPFYPIDATFTFSYFHTWWNSWSRGRIYLMNSLPDDRVGTDTSELGQEGYGKCNSTRRGTHSLVYYYLCIFGSIHFHWRGNSNAQKQRGWLPPLLLDWQIHSRDLLLSWIDFLYFGLPGNDKKKVLLCFHSIPSNIIWKQRDIPWCLLLEQR